MRDAFEEEENVKFSYFHIFNSQKISITTFTKRYEQQLQSYLSQQFSIDQLAFTKENIQNNIETVN